MKKIINLNNKGFTLIESLASFFIAIIIVVMFFSFSVYLKTSSVAIQRRADLDIFIGNKVQEIYRQENWEDVLIDVEVIPSQYGDIYISITNLEETEFFTEKIDLSFSINTLKRDISLERSVFSE